MTDGTALSGLHSISWWHTSLVLVNCLAGSLHCTLALAQVAAHPKGRHKNVMGTPVAGPAVVQLWCVTTEAVSPSGDVKAKSATQQGTAQRGSAPAAMELGICHDGGVVWDLKWRPGRPPDGGDSVPDPAQLPGCACNFLLMLSCAHAMMRSARTRVPFVL